MNELSKERLEYYATTEPPFGYTGGDILEMARELLALREVRERAEPVAWMLTDNEFGHSVATKAGFTLNFYRSKGWGVTPLYTAPPAPVVVPDAIKWPEEMSCPAEYEGSLLWRETEVWNKAVEACQAAYSAAMLAAAPDFREISNSSTNNFRENAETSTSGWIKCSERMPEKDGNYWAWWSESKRQGPAWFIKSELQAQFQSSEITHWMPLPAAPGKEG